MSLNDQQHMAFKNGINIHVDDDYLLRLNASKGHIKVVKYLVENGADIHAPK